MMDKIQEILNDSYLRNSDLYKKRRLEIIMEDILIRIDNCAASGNSHFAYLLSFRNWELDEEEREELKNQVIELLDNAGFDCTAYEDFNLTYIRIDFKEQKYKDNEYYNLFS
jgi:hypothetical protein